MSDLNVIWPPAGRYILAVSGGADSMVLLDIFARSAAGRKYELVVGHFDHGIRPESAADAAFVAAAAAAYGLPFAAAAGGLGAASEAAARAARHTWLEDVRAARQAAAILTAHHQDDLLETSLLNLARGSGRLGLAPMQSGGRLARPLLGLTRADLRAYAAAHSRDWREDLTNSDISNSRNLLRHRLLPAGGPIWRARYLELIEKLAILNTDIDQNIGIMLNAARTSADTFSFDRSDFQSLSATVSAELLIAAARALCPGIQLDHPLVSQAANFARTGLPHKHRPLRQGLSVQIVPGLVRLTTKSPH
jgi:tRNA(Ile)-lysidine synthase